MLPYFYNLGKRLINDETTNHLISLATQRKDEFFAYNGTAGKDKFEDGNSILAKHLYDVPGVKRLLQSCKLKCYPILMMHKPNVKVYRHIDDPNARNTLLITPLQPLTNYPPTFFYESNNLVATCNFDNNNSFLFNTQKQHDLVNYDQIRLNLQLCFIEKFDIIHDRLINHTLFDVFYNQD
jgi:hypothetical protein